MNIDKVRSADGFMRSVATIVLVTYSALVFSPTVHAMQQAQAQRAAVEQADKEARSNLGLSLTRTKDVLRVLAQRPDPWKRRVSSADRRAAKEALRASRGETRQLIEEVRSEFAATGAMLEAKKLPEVIRQRQAEAVAKFEEEVAAFNKDLDDAIDASDEATEKSKAEAALKRLERHKLGRSHQDFDPKNLPNSVLKPDRTRTPKTSVEAFQAALLTGESSVRLAQTGGFDFSHLPGADNPTYLEATTEVVLSDDIKAKAAELHNNPVEIYNWVRNNVQWQPTWGAIQDASHTLSAQRGNAFDISSLTIALLRASGIPARYVYGTIDVPEDKFRNWAGGFQNIDAAMDFASAGGIPLAAVTSGGRITKVRMEHIWVEAAVDFVPSRGAKNRSADSWVAMDPSFKQVEILQGVNVTQVSGFNPAQVAQRFLSSGNIDETAGSASGFDLAMLQNAQAQAQTALGNYIHQLSPYTTVGQVLGGRRIVAQLSPVLGAVLQNRVIAVGARFAVVPTALEQQITFAFGMDIEGFALDPVTLPWAKLNNRQVTLSFRPASSSDQDALRALLPAGELTDISQLPTTIPAYLMRVIPELKVQGATVMSGSPITLGTEVTFVFNPKFVTAGEKPFSYKVPAGAYLDVAVVSGSVSPSAIDEATKKLGMVSDKLRAAGNGSASSLTRDDLLGAPYYASMLDYYGHYQMLGEYAGVAQQGHFLIAAGVGTFGYEPKVDTFFGVPRSLKPGFMSCNVPIVNIVGHSEPSDAKRIAFTVQLGFTSSALEHEIPRHGAAGLDAISAVAAFRQAAILGQRVLVANSDTIATVLPQTQLDPAAQAEVVAAVSAGKIAMLHTSKVAIPGWSGSGYIILDPVTGSGAYKISGGSNGSIQQVADGIAVAASGASGFLDVRVGQYVDRDIWFSERLKYLKNTGRLADALGMLGFGVSAYLIWTDSSLSTTEKIAKTLTELVFYKLTGYLTEQLALAAIAPIGVAGLPLALALVLSVAVTMALAFLLITIEDLYFAGLMRWPLRDDPIRT